MTFPTAQLCTYTRYDQDGKLLGYAPWLHVGLNPEHVVDDCFRHYGRDLQDGDWDCVDIHIFSLPRFLLSLFTPITVTTNKSIRRIRRSGETT